LRINQSVNFFSDDFKPPVIALSATKMAQYLGMVLVVLSLISVAIYYPMMSSEETVQALNAKLKNKKQELDETKRKYPKIIKNKQLDEQLASLREQNSNRVRLLKYLKSDSLQEAQHFSRVFTDLRDYDHKRVWLTRIDVLAEGQSMRLTGLVSQPDILPGYIDGLKQADSFKGRSFNLFNLERDADNASYLHFVLSTEAGGQNEG